MSSGDNVTADENVTSGDVNSAIEQYFTEYENISVHETMLKDEARNDAYQDFIEANADMFKDKIVLDVGAGTGILSMMCAKAGAKRVYAVEASGVSRLCHDIVKANDFSHVISVVHAKVEDIEFLPSEDGVEVKVDILISEWMGFYLLHESMLNSVIVARDKFLKPDGLMIPSHASISICPISMKNYYRENIACWNKVCGFDYTPMKTAVRRRHQEEPVLLNIDKEQCLSKPMQVVALDLKYVDDEDVKDIKTRCQFKLNRNGLLHGFACWFDCEFKTGKENEANNDNKEEDEMAGDHTLSTSPWNRGTHWKQTVLMLPNAFMVSKGDDVDCSICFTQNAICKRRYDVCIEMLEDEDEPEDNNDNNEIKDLISKKIKS